MPTVTLLTEAELRRCVRLDAEAVACVERAFAALAGGAVAMPPVLRLDIADRRGEVDVKTAYVPGFDSFAIKISPGFFDNPALGLPSLNGLMVLLSARTGLVDAVLLDNGYLTDLRTAAAGAVAAKWLARPDAGHAGVIGAGAQARLQIEALALVRPIRRVLVWARDPARAEACAADLRGRLGIAVEARPDAESVVRDSEIVVTTTPSERPLVERDWLHPGLHITAMGSDAGHKNELAPAIVADADVFVCDRQSQCATLGELHHAVAAGLVAGDAAFPELGAVIAGAAPGRTADAQVTVCDLTGTGVQDTAIANLAFGHARARGAGVSLQT